MVSRRGKGLAEAESLVLEAAWNGWSYEQASEQCSFSRNYLQRTLAPKLWRFLTAELAKGESIDKRSFRSYMMQLGEDELSELSERCQRFRVSRIASFVGGGTLPPVNNFYGRTFELGQLSEAILYCRCVVVTGIWGVGKTTLVSKYIHDLASHKNQEFERVVWWPIHYSTPLPELLMELIRHLDPKHQEEQLSPVPQILATRLIECFKARRCLVILDGLETLLQSPESEYLGSSCEVSEFLVFLDRVIKEWHQSCLLLASRVWIKELTYQQESGLSVYQFQLKGLDIKSSLELLKSQGLEVDKNWENLIETYRGNPLILQRISTQVKHFLRGNIDILFSNKTSFGRDTIQDLFRKQLENEIHLGCLESSVLLTLAKNEVKSMTFGQLLKTLNQDTNVSATALVRTLGILEGCFLIESGSDDGNGELSLSIQPIMKNYVLSDPHRLIAAPLKLLPST